MSTSNSWPYDNTLVDTSDDIITITLGPISSSSSTMMGSAGGAGSGSIYSYPTSNIYATSGTGLNWDTNWNDTISITSGIYENALRVNGDAEISGKLKVEGRDIGEILNKIEERLAILHPNPELESRWDELRELGERYRALETELKEKELMWAKLTK